MARLRIVCSQYRRCQIFRSPRLVMTGDRGSPPAPAATRSAIEEGSKQVATGLFSVAAVGKGRAVAGRLQPKWVRPRLVIRQAVVRGFGGTMDDAKRSVNCSARDFVDAWWRGDAGPVPCAGCSACCYYAGIPVDKKRDRKRLPHLLTERNRDGELVLQRRADGACVHLGERGCTVYEHRPAVCRSFDCRAFSAMGLVEHCDPDHRTPDWQFAAPEQALP
jgi:hypothetical protein